MTPIQPAAAAAAAASSSSSSSSSAAAAAAILRRQRPRRRPSILLIGDSITQQAFGTAPDGKVRVGWGGLLASSYQRRADVLERGYYGYNTDHALDVLPRVVENGISVSRRDAVSRVLFCTVLFGSNDAVDAGQPQHVPVERYRSNLRKILTSVRERLDMQRRALEVPPPPPPPPPIILMTPPPVYEPAWAAFKGVSVSTRKNGKMREYGVAASEVGSEFDHCEVIDLWELLGGGHSNDEERSKYVTDGVHLNEEGNRLVYGAVMDLLKAKFPNLLPMDYDDHDDDGDGKYGERGGIPVEEKLWTEMGEEEHTGTAAETLDCSENQHPVPAPWSKQHKKMTKAGSGGLKHSLSNSFAQPLTTKELVQWSLERGDQAIVDEYSNHSLEYTPNGGSSDLREAIADLYGPDISAENILVFPGAQVAIQTAARAICHSNMHAITFTPGYQSVVASPAHVGAGSVTQIPLKPDNGWQIDLDQVKSAIRESTRYIVVNEPYNPAGTLMSLTTQQELISLANQHGIYLLCDEVYRLLEHDPNDRLPTMADSYSRGLSCVTLSKPWGACGITIGWIATQDPDLMDRLTDLQYFGTACPSRASELLAIMCLRESDRILSRNLEILRHNKALLEKFMSDYRQFFHWVPPTAGAIAAVRFKGPLTSQELGDKMAAAGIGIKPAYCFNEKEDITCENDYFRIGFGEANKVPAALDALRRFVDENKAGWLQVMSSYTD